MKYVCDVFLFRSCSLPSSSSSSKWADTSYLLGLLVSSQCYNQLQCIRDICTFKVQQRCLFFQYNLMWFTDVSSINLTGCRKVLLFSYGLFFQSLIRCRQQGSCLSITTFGPRSRYYQFCALFQPHWLSQWI